MMELVNLINQYSGLLNVMVAFITAIITLIYVIFKYKKMKASQDSLKLAIKQFKVDKQPCIVYKTIKSEGTHCFYKQRRQLHINLKIENIGDAPAMSIYVFSYLQLQNSNLKSKVNMDYLPDYVPFLKAGTKTKVSVRYETDEINLLLEDLSVTSAKNVHRINTDATREAYKGVDLVIEIYYKNLLGQWFVNERHTEVLEVLERKENGKTQIVNPPNSLKEDVWFELQLIATAFSKCDIRMADKQEIKEKLEPYGRYREMGNDE